MKKCNVLLFFSSFLRECWENNVLLFFTFFLFLMSNNISFIFSFTFIFQAKIIFLFFRMLDYFLQLFLSFSRIFSCFSLNWGITREHFLVFFWHFSVFLGDLQASYSGNQLKCGELSVLPLEMALHTCTCIIYTRTKIRSRAFLLLGLRIY